MQDEEVVAALCVLIGVVVVHFIFSGFDEGGTGGATMEISIGGAQLTAILGNTSPVDLDDETNDGNSPGIIGFGFDLYPELLSVAS